MGFAADLSDSLIYRFGRLQPQIPAFSLDLQPCLFTRLGRKQEHRPRADQSAKQQPGYKQQSG